MDQARKDRILEKVAGLPGPLKARVVQSIKGFSPEIQKAVLRGHPVPKGGETMFRNAMNQAKAVAGTPVEEARINAHLAGKRAANKISTTTVLPKTRAKPLIQEGMTAKQPFKEYRAAERLRDLQSRDFMRRGVGIGAGALGLGGLGYLALKGRGTTAVPEEEVATGAPSGSWG